jgi:large subunit ribosomal protein L3
MGKSRPHRPHRGSKQFWPRKRSKRIYPRIKNWNPSQKGLLGFAGYKAGMTHVMAIDNRPKSPTKGEEIKVPATVLETPPMKVAAIRLYEKTLYGLKAIGEVWAQNIDKNFTRKTKTPKKPHTLDNLKKLLPSASDARLLVYTQPQMTSLNKKKPELMEMALGGSVEEQFKQATEMLGKEIKPEDTLKEGQFIDVHSITKGKGWQGVVKRFGVRLLSHKAEKGRRKIGNLGPKGTNVKWWIAMPGQMGYHTRTEYNKKILKIGDKKTDPVNPAGGFIRYGEVKGPYMLIAGSVPGPKKRLVRLSTTTRPRKGVSTQPFDITLISRRSQQ